MHSDTGLIGQAWSCLREAWFGEYFSRLLLLDYRKLASAPAETMRRLYTALGEPPFDHDFSNVAYDAAEYDSALGMPGMHTVSQRVEYRERPTCLPPDMLAKYAGLNFWNKPEFNEGRMIL